MSKAEERTLARDFVMARLAACRGSLALACSALDDAFVFFVEPDDDKRGVARAEMLETIDECIGNAARAVQAAQAAWEDLDPKEGEPDLDEDEEEDEEESDADDEDEKD